MKNILISEGIINIKNIFMLTSKIYGLQLKYERNYHLIISYYIQTQN